MLLFLFWVGVLRLIGFDVNIWGAASMALTLYSSAYLAEVWRGAIQSLPDGHWEGAAAKGLRFLPTLRLVILPEAFRVSIAPTVGFLVQIIEGTSLACIIGFSDLMSIGKRWPNAPLESTEPFIIYPLMALIYFALCFPFSRLEKRLGAVPKTAPVAA